MTGKMRNNGFAKGPKKGPTGSVSAGFCQAVDIEQAAHGVNQINRQKKQERYTTQREAREQAERARITLSPVLDEWLKRKIP